MEKLFLTALIAATVSFSTFANEAKVETKEVKKEEVKKAETKKEETKKEEVKK